MFWETHSLAPCCNWLSLYILSASPASPITGDLRTSIIVSHFTQAGVFPSNQHWSISVKHLVGSLLHFCSNVFKTEGLIFSFTPIRYHLSTTVTRSSIKFVKFSSATRIGDIRYLYLQYYYYYLFTHIPPTARVGTLDPIPISIYNFPYYRYYSIY